MSQTGIDFGPIESAIGPTETTISRDLKLNLKRILEDGSLDFQQGLFSLLALSCTVEYSALASEAHRQLAKSGVSPEQVREAAESSAIMGMLNVYYRFKHMIHNDEKYTTAQLRMTSLAKPVLGKTLFEMLAFAVSCVNGCESCIVSHEKVLIEAGVNANQIHDLARMAAVVKGLKALAYRYPIA